MANNAAELLAGIFAEYGLPEMSEWFLDTYLNNDTVVDSTTMLLELRKTDAYKKRFPAMDFLQKQAAAGGKGWNEGMYIQQENAYRTAFADSGLPPSMWDSSDDFAELMKKDVAPDEVEARVEAARAAVLSTDPATREQMQRLYGIGVNDLMAYALVPDRMATTIQRIANTSILAGMGANAGVGTGMGAGEWEGYAEALTDSSRTTVQGAISGAQSLLTQQSRLAKLEGDQFTDKDALDVAVKQDAKKTLKSQRRAEREKTRFSGTQGVASRSLGGSTL